MIRPLRLLAFLGLLLLGLGALGDTTAQSSPTVSVLRVEGTIVPVVAQYIDRGLDEAEQRGDAAVVIELSTPGGLYDTTQEIVTRILNARVPVIVYVSPAGGWAGSAGTFITLSAHVAAMAPGSRIGAAHPVSGGGTLTPTQEAKVTEDAAAFMRSIARLRGRDLDRAEAAVRQSRSFSDEEALQGNLIDLRADTLAGLLARVHGRKVTLADGREVTLNTSPATTRPLGMNSIERFLQMISNPNIAYILLTIGSIGIIAELYNPGMIFPGVVGGVSLLLGFYTLGVLNAYWGGVLLILLAFALFVADIFVPSHGILTAGGIVALTVGSLMLFSRNPSILQVNLGLVVAVVVAISAFFVFVIAAVVRGQRRKAVTGREGLVGQTATVVTPLAPHGVVLVEGERWAATAAGQSIEAGEEVVVDRLEGLTLFVSKKPIK
ncbi:MAG: nodulation protein NfeD [Chloroflexi bacterium]|nr:nodulation protein NfeD [Chloroflexota bacterium]